MNINTLLLNIPSTYIVYTKYMYYKNCFKKFVVIYKQNSKYNYWYLTLPTWSLYEILG